MVANSLFLCLALAYPPHYKRKKNMHHVYFSYFSILFWFIALEMVIVEHTKLVVLKDEPDMMCLCITAKTIYFVVIMRLFLLALIWEIKITIQHAISIRFFFVSFWNCSFSIIQNILLLALAQCTNDSVFPTFTCFLLLLNIPVIVINSRIWDVAFSIIHKRDENKTKNKN